MTRLEFVKVMAYIEAATGKSVSSDTAEVYFDLLGDLPVGVFQLAAKRVVLEHRWATFPSVAELREAASETAQGAVKPLSAGEAWSIAWKAAGRIDPEISGSAERGLAGLPELVVEAVRAFGIPALCCGREPVGVVRAQFVKIFEQLAAREKRIALMPPAIRQAVAAIGAGENVAAPRLGAIGRAVATIGHGGSP